MDEVFGRDRIGPPGCGLKDATYVPPPADEMTACLDALERFLDYNTMPPLIHAALAHTQFEATREQHYAHLLAVTREGAWSRWLMYFLRGVRQQADDAIRRIQDIDGLVWDWRVRLAGVQSGRPEMVLLLFAGNPLWTVGGISKELGVAYTTAKRAIDRLEAAGIVSLVRAAKRNRVYCALEMLNVLEASSALGRPASKNNATLGEYM